MNSFSPEIDISKLPKEARRELIDFYQFLINKYGTKTKKERKNLLKFLSTPIKVDKIIVHPRDELHER